MARRPVSQSLALRVYGTVRALVGFSAVFLVLMLSCVVFLRLYGVPDPLLREVVRRVNAAGIPADVGSIRLTLRGWRAEDVRYFSMNPDDLDPLFHVKELYFDRKDPLLGISTNQGWQLEVDARGITLSPSIGWGVELPPESACRAMESLAGVLAFEPDRVELSHGKASWLGIRFAIDGTVVKATTRAAAPVHAALPPRVWLSASKCRAMEDRLTQITVAGDATIELSFSIDLGDYAKNTATFSANLDSVNVRGVDFSEVGLEGRFIYPVVDLGRGFAAMDGQQLEVRGQYDVATGQAEVSLLNGIESDRLLLLLPASVQRVIASLGLKVPRLPKLEVSAGPAPFNRLHESIAGTFAVRDAVFRGLEIESLHGGIRRTGGLLEFFGLEGRARGQEWLAQETGSAMRGGSAKGRVFWDAGTDWFGVEAEGSLDPNLLVHPLDMVDVATNVITRFRFLNEPPVCRIKLGANMENWRTFFIDVQATATDAVVHDAVFSSINASAHYTNGVLRLDPMAALKGEAFLKGSASIDFRASDASFDALTSLPPEVLEDLIHPRLRFFGEKISTTGEVRIEARGSIDWDEMATTDFTAEVSAAHLDTPVAGLDRFSSNVSAQGPNLRLDDAVFSLYGGQGTGRMGVELDPAERDFPYDMQVDLDDVDFYQCLRYLNPSNELNVAGKLCIDFDFAADFSRGFFDCANGSGTLSIHHGQLADLPLFQGFSRLVRKVIPGFNVFSITSLAGAFTVENGVIRSDDAYFEGDVVSAAGRGTYSQPAGFDAYLQARAFSDNRLSRVVRVLTDPIFKFFEIKLDGPLSNPAWRLEKVPEGVADFFRVNKE